MSEDILSAESGDIITPDKGFAQVAVNKYYAHNYLPDESCSPVLFEIKCPKGAKVSIAKHTGTGAKVGMFPRNTKFKVLSKERVNIPIVYGKGYYEDRMVTKYELEYIV